MGNKPNDAAREPRLSPSIKDLAAKAKQAAVKAQGTVLKAVDKNGNRQLRKRIFSGMHFKNHLIAACFGDVQQIPGAHALLGAQLCQIELCLFF